jgi:hypothetical protein
MACNTSYIAFANIDQTDQRSLPAGSPPVRLGCLQYIVLHSTTAGLGLPSFRCISIYHRSEPRRCFNQLPKNLKEETTPNIFPPSVSSMRASWQLRPREAARFLRQSCVYAWHTTNSIWGPYSRNLIKQCPGELWPGYLPWPLFFNCQHSTWEIITSSQIAFGQSDLGGTRRGQRMRRSRINIQKFFGMIVEVEVWSN